MRKGVQSILHANEAENESSCFSSVHSSRGAVWYDSVPQVLDAVKERSDKPEEPKTHVRVWILLPVLSSFKFINLSLLYIK